VLRTVARAKKAAGAQHDLYGCCACGLADVAVDRSGVVIVARRRPRLPGPLSAMPRGVFVSRPVRAAAWQVSPLVPRTGRG
jgi:hypothetical protein